MYCWCIRDEFDIAKNLNKSDKGSFRDKGN